MKLNRDLLDALMMLGLICLVLLGTTEFDNESTKAVSLAALAVFNLILAGLRIKAARQPDERQEEYWE